MRKTIIFAAVAGLGVGFLGMSGANAMTSTSSAGVRVATDAMDTSALVHCRPFKHWHPWGRSFGCGGEGGGSVEIRRGHRAGVGVEERGRTSIHSRTTTSREGTSVRGSTSTRTGESGKSSTTTTGKAGTSTTSKSGTSGGTSGRAQGGEKSSTGGSAGGAGGSSGGMSGGQSGGQKQ